MKLVSLISCVASLCASAQAVLPGCRFVAVKTNRWYFADWYLAKTDAEYAKLLCRFLPLHKPVGIAAANQRLWISNINGGRVRCAGVDYCSTTWADVVRCDALRCAPIGKTSPDYCVKSASQIMCNGYALRRA